MVCRRLVLPFSGELFQVEEHEQMNCSARGFPLRSLYICPDQCDLFICQKFKCCGLAVNATVIGKERQYR